MGKLLVFSAPSGAGKSTLIKAVKKVYPSLVFSVSATTRSQREGEVDGVDYDFLTMDQFKTGIEHDDFVEYEDVHGQYYGTRKSRIQKELDEGKDLIFDLDVLGALSIRRVFPEAILFYIDVPSVDTLKQRLISRNREGTEEINRRLERYEFEKGYRDQFDHIILNDDLDTAINELSSIIADVLA